MEDNLQKIRHSLAHLLAAAVLERYPKAKLTLGPAIDNGFYYDVDFGQTGKDHDFTTDLKEFEKSMKKKLSNQKWAAFSHREVSQKEAEEKYEKEGNEYKLELIKEIAERQEKITFYTVGDFEDLCRGGHVETLKEIKPDSFKLERVAGAYWRGDEKNPMLTRIYGLAFETKEALDAYETQIEEAKKRDHRLLGQKLDLFVFSDLVGPGLPLYTHRGTTVLKEIKNYSNQLQEAIGYQQVQTPNMNRAELFKVSGHYEKYQDDMFKVSSHYSKEDYYLKPMNCPQHTQLYASKQHSYKELPVRISDFANLYRDEKTGELSGLTRLRAFSQDDGHCFCMESQIKDEFKAVLSAIQQAMKTYGMDYKIRLSLWDPAKPEKYLGQPETWEKSQRALEEILVENNIDFEKGVGEAAIYGPKMDLISKDSLGRSWQLGTIQLDFIMPERFGLTYVDSDGSQKTPVMIHRALVGSPERFMGILLEHYAGNFPVWLSPVQAVIIPISEEKHGEFANQVAAKLQASGFRFQVMAENESLGKKIRQAEMQKVPYLLVIGDKEMEANAVAVRARSKGDLGQMSVEAFIEKIAQEIQYKT